MANGDPLLTRVIDESPDRRVRRLAAVVVDGPAGRIRSCFLDADADSQWEIGSVSKALTGLLVADAVDRGEVSLATTLEQLDPQYAGSAAGTATVRELATHTSGLPPTLTDPLAMLGFLVFGVDPYQSTSPTRVARGARRQRLRTRGRYRYSNLGASVLGHALAHQAGVDYAELLRARLAEPVGMAATTALRRDGRAPLRGWRADGRRSHLWRMPGYLPAGGVVSTAADLTTLMLALLNGSAPGPASLSPLDGAVVGGRPRSRQAMFWIVDTDEASGRRKIWHNGQTGGYAAYLALFPDTDRAMVVLLDLADAGRAERIADRLIRAVVDDSR
ncbi:MAG: serine hydrolase domain-containing protein [Lapillicoccus sp.]